MPLQDVTPESVTALFAPERPGPNIYQHIRTSGVGFCRADRTHNPLTAVAELPGGNVACRGEPLPIPSLRGLVEAPPDWVPALRSVATVGVWDRIVAVLPDGANPQPRHDVRPLVVDDLALMDGLDPAIDWISETWGGDAGLTRSGKAWVAIADGHIAAIATSFYVGLTYEDIGVVTEPAYRARGLATSCAAALIDDIRGRGRRPTWTTSPDNAGSRAVAVRLGFVHERDDVLYAVGIPIPTG